MISAWRTRELASYDPGYGPLVKTRVRIATWNLWGRYGPWEARLPVIIENLDAINADILALQEVWEDDTRSQAEEIAAALGCTEPVYAANLERDGARSGNAVLSRWPITRHEVRKLPRRGAHDAIDEEGEERLCVFAEVDGPTRADPDVLRAPQLVRRPQRDPPGAGRRDLPLRDARRGRGRSRPCCAATSTPTRRATRSGCSPAARRRPCHASCSATRGRPPATRRARLHVVEREPVRGGRRSISTAASIT